MVSKARLDLPEPESPVTTTSRSRGISRETFFRLCTRAPCTAMVVRAEGRALATTPLARRGGGAGESEERQLPRLQFAPPGQLPRCARLADQPLVGEVLARPGHPLDAEVAPEVVLDLGGRAGLPHL